MFLYSLIVIDVSPCRDSPMLQIVYELSFVFSIGLFSLLVGTSEAFLHAVATEDQLKRSNNSLVLFSFIYVVLNILLIRSAGAVGLIFANALSILHSVVVISLPCLCVCFPSSHMNAQLL